MLVIGIGLVLLCATLLLAVLVNLPDSWVGLIDMAIGFGAGISCIVYFFRQKPILLIPISVLLAITLIIFLVFPPK